MKITKVQAIPIGTALKEPLRWGKMAVATKGGILVKVDTDEGVFGIGEAGFSSEYFSTVGPVVNERLAPLLLGEDPLDVAMLWHKMFDATHMWGRRGVETYAISGVDIALWDLLGKVAGQPVYKVLGAAKHSVSAYFAPSLKPTPEIVAEARQAVFEDGYCALKLRVNADLKAGQELVSAVREAIGSETDIMVDANMAYDRRTALEMARFLESKGVVWLEEPINCHSLTQYVEEHTWLAERVDMRLAGGESLFTRYEFPELLKRHTFDVVQPDCTGVGGISEAKRIADMASAWNISCVPHIACSSGTGVSLAAGLHVVLACDNAPYVELDAYGGPGWDGLVIDPIMPVNGCLVADNRPGLGVELSEDALERFSLV